MSSMNNQSKALIIASKAAGWDPTRIFDTSTKTYGEDISNFNIPRDTMTNPAGTGKLPQPLPDTSDMFEDAKGGPALSEKLTFAVPGNRDAIPVVKHSGTGKGF